MIRGKSCIFCPLFFQSIGKGSFGVVYKAVWKCVTVAVKKVETESEVCCYSGIELKPLIVIHIFFFCFVSLYIDGYIFNVCKEAKR